MHIHTEPARKVASTAKMLLALLAALAIAISTIALIDPAPAHAQETEATSEGDATDAPSDATSNAAEEAASEEPGDQPAVVEEAPEATLPESEAEATEDAPSEEATPEEKTEEAPSEEDRFSIEVDGEYHNQIMSDLTSSRSRRARAAAPSADPRYTCGLDIALLVDTSESTMPFQQNEKNAANRAISNLVNTGSSLGIIQFAGNARTVLQKTELTSSNVNQARSAVNNMSWTSTNGTNIPAALKLAAQGGYDAVIIITDGQPNSSTSSGTTNTATTDLDLANTVQAAQAVKNSGATIFGLGVTGGRDTAVMNLTNTKTGLPRPNWWYPDSDPLPSYLRRSERGEKLEYGANGALPSWMYYDTNKLKEVWTSDNVSGPIGNRQVTASFGQKGELYTMRALDGNKFMQSWSDSYDTVTSDLTNLESKIDALTSGCWGTVNLQKEIVDSNGVVQQGQDVSGFEFVADKALNGSNVQNNFTVGTDDQGKATVHYPTTDGVGSMTLKETERDGYKLYQQTVGGQKTLARCEATTKNGGSVPVSYGSGSGIVVKSNPDQNSFTLSGVGQQHRVNCTVQNNKGKPDFTLLKQPFGNTEPRVITGEANQTIKVEYLVSAQNDGTGAGKVPAIMEKPSAPNGMSVVSVEALPEGQNPLVQNSTTLSKSGDTWKLDPAATNDVDAKQTRTAKIIVTYRVNQPGNVNKDQLTCENGNNSKGLFNHVELEGTQEAKQKADACVSATVPGVELKKLINNADANTKEEATSIMGGTNQVTIEYQIKNTGTTPLTEIRLDDFNLDKDSGAKQGPINMAGLTCDAASISDNNLTKVITPNSPLAKDQTLKCRWTASAPIVPAEGEYHGDRGIVLASYNLPAGQGGSVKPVTSENDAWLFKLPVAVGVLPDAGAKGPTQYLILGGLIAMAGAFWAYRRRP